MKSLGGLIIVLGFSIVFFFILGVFSIVAAVLSAPVVAYYFVFLGAIVLDILLFRWMYKRWGW